MFWRSFVSHHTRLVNVYFTPPAIRKSEGGPPCCSMPLGARSGILLVGAGEACRKCVRQHALGEGCASPL